MVELSGQIRLTLDGSPARLVARGSELRLEVDRLAPLWRGGSLRDLPRIAGALDHLGLTLHVVWRNREVMVLGAGAGPASARFPLFARWRA